MNSHAADATVKRNARSRKRAWRALAPCVRPCRRQSSGRTHGLIFQSRRFRQACHVDRLAQEFVTPYTPEQNGLIERFFRSLNEECARLYSFASFADAKAAIRRWIEWYSHGRPYQGWGIPARVSIGLSEQRR